MLCNLSPPLCKVGNGGDRLHRLQTIVEKVRKTGSSKGPYQVLVIRGKLNSDSVLDLLSLSPRIQLYKKNWKNWK